MFVIGDTSHFFPQKKEGECPRFFFKRTRCFPIFWPTFTPSWRYIFPGHCVKAQGGIRGRRYNQTSSSDPSPPSSFLRAAETEGGERKTGIAEGGGGTTSLPSTTYLSPSPLTSRFCGAGGGGTNLTKRQNKLAWHQIISPALTTRLKKKRGRRGTKEVRHTPRQNLRLSNVLR